MAAGVSVGQRASWRDSFACQNRRAILLPYTDCQGRPFGMRVAGRTTRCCSGCAMKESAMARALIMAGANLARPGSWGCFLTLTEGSEPRDFTGHSEAVGRFLEDLRVDQWKLRGGKGKAPLMAYIGVAELQEKRLDKHGQVAWHTHLLIRDWRPMTRERMLELLNQHRLGESFNWKAFKISERNAGSIASYMTKKLSGYLRKNYRGESYELAMSLLPKGKRLIRHSGAWAPGVTLKSLREASIRELKERMAIRRHDETGCECGHPLVHLGPTGVEDAIREILGEMGLVYPVGEDAADAPPEPEPPWTLDIPLEPVERGAYS